MGGLERTPDATVDGFERLVGDFTLGRLGSADCRLGLRHVSLLGIAVTWSPVADTGTDVGRWLAGFYPFWMYFC